MMSRLVQGNLLRANRGKRDVRSNTTYDQTGTKKIARDSEPIVHKEATIRNRSSSRSILKMPSYKMNRR